MTTYAAQSSITVEGANTIVDRVCEHLATHGVSVSRDGGHRTLTSYHGTCEIAFDRASASFHVTSPTLTGIAVIREQIAGHLIEFSPELSDRIVWSGDGGEQIFPIWFCLLTVAESRRITPHMQRITFTGIDLDRYAGMADIHVRLMFPLASEQDPQWPQVGANGVTHYPDADVLAIRKYTIRQIDPDAGTMDIDFVLHKDAGPGSDFAQGAQIGDMIGMGGPGGRCAPLDRDWYLLAGDETALPAMARILEALPQTARGVAIIEVADEGEQQEIASKSQIDVRWVHRKGESAGASSLLPDAIEALDFPNAQQPMFAWVGCEHDTAMAIKSHLRKVRKIDKKDDLVVSYWRR